MIERNSVLDVPAASRPTMTRSEAEDFLFLQANHIDGRDFASWLNLFTSDATYWIPARPEDTDPSRQLSFMYDDVPTMIARCKRLVDQGAAGQQPITRSNHLISNVMVEDAEDSETVIVRSRFHVAQFRRDMITHYMGAYTHQLVDRGGGLKIRSQRVDLIDCDGIHEQILQVYL